MKEKFSGYREKIIKSFNAPGMAHTLGIEIDDFGPGWFRSRLVPDAKVFQHHGFVHAGAIATIADLSGGFAACSLMAEEEGVLTIEFKINLLRPAVGELIICRAGVLRAGRRIYVSESEVFCVQDGREKLVAKATVTLAVVDDFELSVG